MPDDTNRPSQHDVLKPEGSVASYHKRYALLQTVVFIVAVGAFLALLVDHNLQREKLDREHLGEHFAQQVLGIEAEFDQLQSGMIRLRMNADEALFQSRNHAAPMHDLFRYLKSTPDGKAFHLDDIRLPYRKESVGNLTGDGSLEGRSPDFLREISMTLTLCAGCDRLAKIMPHLTWIYYYSKDNFALYYPWCLSKDTRFAKNAYATTAWTLGLPENNPKHEPYWTEVYFDAAGKGLMISCLTPVYDQDRFLGVVGADLSVNHLNGMIRRIEQRRSRNFVIYDHLDNVIAAPGLIAAADKQVTKLETALPAALSSASERLRQMPPGEVQTINGWWVVSKGFARTPFRAIYFESAPSKAQVLVANVGYGAFVLLGIMAILLIISLTISYWVFVRPSEIFLRHILTRSSGCVPDKVRWIPKAWRPWFQTITREFDDKEALTRDLEVRNHELGREIVERKHADEALRKSEEKYRFLTENIKDVVWIMDVETLYFRYVSPSVERLRGYTAEEIVGEPVTKALTPEASDRLVNTIRSRADDFLSGKEPAGKFYTDEVEQPRKDGSTVWTEVITSYYRNPENDRVELRGVSRDITDRRRVEAQLLQMQKLQSVGTLAGGIAHDFNNVLLGLFGNISLAKDGLGTNHPSYSFLEEAERSMSRGVRLTKQLLTFAKGGAPIKEEVNLGTLVEEVARFDLSGSNTSLVYQQAEALWRVDADEGQIQQAISNLVINARQAMPNGGHLYITLTNEELKEGSIPGLSHGGYVRVDVRDEGTGIDPKVIDSIFDPYFTTKQTGNGLGLATVYSIISKHGGHIGVISETGKGATFTFYLPASKSCRHTSPEQAVAEPPAPTRTARILVMDDEEVIRNIVVHMLTRSGFSVATAPGGEEAIEMCKIAYDAGTPFDVVIMDLTIPGGVGGKEAIQALLEIDPDACGIVSSGYADDPVMANWADYGFKGTVAKPYSKDDLMAVLSQVLKM